MDGLDHVADQQSNDSKTHNLKSLFSSPDRDFLVRNNGDQVQIDSLNGKKVGIYFSAKWCGPCRQFTPILSEVYNELLPSSGFEIVFVSGDQDEESFKEYFSKMPWLAIPFSDSDSREGLSKLFEVAGIPSLVILEESGKVSTEDGVEFIRDYGVDAYPFTSEKIKEIKDREEAARRDQSLKTILVSSSRDFVITSDDKKVSVAELEGKTVGLYFYYPSYPKCSEFTPKLVKVYEELKAKGENFEIVTISLDEDEESFKQNLGTMPWLSLPFKDKSSTKLARYFDLSTLPTLVIIGPDGKTLQPDVVETIEEHGPQAYPFTPEKYAKLEEIEKARQEAQTLESLLVSGDLNFVIGKDDVKVPVSDLVGKTILLSFSAHWCPPCRAFLPTLIEAYNQIKAKDDSFEVIFISSDRDEASFKEYFSQMPWLALPFRDERGAALKRIFKIQGIPALVALGPSGRTVTTEARQLIMCHGADAYPFTAEKLKEIEEQYKEMTKGWPEKVQHELHEHELELTRCGDYLCDGCDGEGSLWAYNCSECEFDLHAKCALDEEKGAEDDTAAGNNVEKKEAKEGWVCDGDVCHKA